MTALPSLPTMPSTLIPWFAALSLALIAVVILAIRLRTLNRRNEALRAENTALATELAALEAESAARSRAEREKIRLLETAEERLGREFENLANRLFEEKQRRFTEESRSGIEALLAPMRQQIETFRARLEETHGEENRQRAALTAELHMLKDMHQRLSADAANLAAALKGESKIRGNWGEMILERLLEEAGLGRGREFETQKSLTNSDGRRLQPDVIVHLPGGRDVIIDAKVSLVAYDAYYAAEDETTRKKQLKRHIASMRAHIQGLSAKAYEDIDGLESLELVIMFVPIEPALLLALGHEPGLITQAYENNVLLAGPTTLMAMLSLVHSLWRREDQDRFARQIAAEAGKLHDQFVLFLEAFEKIGDQIDKARTVYQTAHKRLTSGRGNLVRRAMTVAELGARTRKKIPPALAADADEAES